MFLHKGKGRLIYDPKRNGMKSKTDWWLIATVDPEIVRYYRDWVKRTYHVKGLCPPSWGAHISIVRGEGNFIKDKSLWKKYENQWFNFEYEHNPTSGNDGQTEGKYWFIDVYSNDFMRIRKELGLKTYYKFHLTVGRTWY